MQDFFSYQPFICHFCASYIQLMTYLKMELVTLGNSLEVMNNWDLSLYCLVTNDQLFHFLHSGDFKIADCKIKQKVNWWKKKHENFQFFQIISLEKINKEFLVCHFFLSFLMSLLFFTHCKALKLLVFSTKGNGNGWFPFKFWLPHFIVQCTICQVDKSSFMR